MKFSRPSLVIALSAVFVAVIGATVGSTLFTNQGLAGFIGTTTYVKYSGNHSNCTFSANYNIYPVVSKDPKYPDRDSGLRFSLNAEFDSLLTGKTAADSKTSIFGGGRMSFLNSGPGISTPPFWNHSTGATSELAITEINDMNCQKGKVHLSGKGTLSSLGRLAGATVIIDLTPGTPWLLGTIESVDIASQSLGITSIKNIPISTGYSKVDLSDGISKQ